MFPGITYTGTPFAAGFMVARRVEATFRGTVLVAPFAPFIVLDHCTEGSNRFVSVNIPILALPPLVMALAKVFALAVKVAAVVFAVAVVAVICVCKALLAKVPVAAVKMLVK